MYLIRKTVLPGLEEGNQEEGTSTGSEPLALRLPEVTIAKKRTIELIDIQTGG